MRANYQYRILKIYRELLGYGYRALKKFLRWTSCYRTYLGCVLKAMRIESRMPAMPRVIDKSDLHMYKARWRVLWPRIPAVFLRLYSTLSGVKSSDYVPDSLYFTHIEPMLNNREYSRSFADKNMYSLLIEKNLLPVVWLRKMHGAYLNEDYKLVLDVDEVLLNLAGQQARVMLKASVDSQGGKSIVMLESKGGGLYSGSEKVTKEWLEQHFKDNFLLQEVVKQHSFYEALNPSSLNTFRVYTYRSVVDESVHVLHSVLRVGAPGFVIDNVSSGGKACGVSSDGVLNGKIYGINGKVYKKLNGLSSPQGTKLFKYEAVMDLARKLAAEQPYCRVIGFDLCVDTNERVLLIELNNFDIGVEMLQFCNGPLFGPFTNEVLTYCVQKKKGFRYPIF